MELTGKTKIEFEEWYLSIKHFDSLTVFESGKINQFNNLPENMKYGVYEDYFDSVGIDIDEILEGCLYLSFIYENGEGDMSHHRPIARTAAIEKANDIRNEQLNK